ncbi:MFS transporter [Nocardia acidivorans]|uniref:MFS transporter n=1 Tax=Nocardia acidivorans TaxID=404580 RepID=UPI0008335C4C|nr:MFS transporter [Nocardia acidivorans]
MTAAISGPTARPVTAPGAWIALAACLTAVFMQMLDLTIVHTAMPALARDLRADGPAELLVVSAYGLAFACTLPAAAGIGDLLGRHTVFAAALIAFAGASVWCGISSGADELILARAAAGVAAALISAQTIAIIADAFPERLHATAFGIYGATAALAGMLGPLLGGVLVDTGPLGSGWRAIFLVNLPVAAGAVALARGYARARRLDVACESARSPAASMNHAPAQSNSMATGSTGAVGESMGSGSRWLMLMRRFDFAGTLLSALGLGLLVYPLTEGRALGWPPSMIALAGLSVPVLAVFVRQQRWRAARGDEPLIRPELFADRAFAMGAVLTAGFYGVFTALLFTVSVAAQSGLGWSASRTGMVMLPFALGAVLGALSSPILVSLCGSRALTVGVTVFAVALGAIASTVHTAGAASDLRALAWPVFAAGAGMGWFAGPLPSVMLGGVVERATGSASGIVPTVQQVGSALGVAVLGTVFFAEAAARSYLSAITTVLWLMAAVSLLLAVLTLALPRQRT